jgi:hypothetical protein
VHPLRIRPSLSKPAGPLAALLAVCCCAPAVGGGTIEGQSRQGSATLRIGVRSDYAVTADRATRREAFTAGAQWRFASPESHGAALVVEYRFVREQPDTLLVGAMWSYQTARWSVAASPLFKQTESADGRWLYWGSLRRRVAQRHAFGVELYGSLETLKGAEWLVGYYARVSDSLSLNLSVGAGLDDGPDQAARTTIVWQFRPKRR